MKETDIQKQITEYLTAKGFLVIRNYLGGIHYHGSKVRPNPNAGMPDLMCIKAGITHFIEVKATLGRISSKQKQWHKKAYDVGIVVHVFRSLDDCMNIF